MTNFNSEVARDVYQQIKQDPSKKFPVTAILVDGILQSINYSHHNSVPQWASFIHLFASWEILTREKWDGKWWVKRAIQNILNLPRVHSDFEKAA